MKVKEDREKALMSLRSELTIDFNNQSGNYSQQIQVLNAQVVKANEDREKALMNLRSELTINFQSQQGNFTQQISKLELQINNERALLAKQKEVNSKQELLISQSSQEVGSLQ